MICGKLPWRRFARAVSFGVFCAGLALAAALLGGCGKADGARKYEVRGIVREPLSQDGEIVVEHEDVAGLMPSMTMPFTPEVKSEAAGFQPGDGVSFTLTLTDKGATIGGIRHIDAASVKLPAPTPRKDSGETKRVKEGDACPPFSLVDQNGNAFTSSALEGTYTLVDFIFTRCAVPNYCPLMTRNFAQIASSLTAAAPGKVRLLSVSFDPQDTPDVLRQYAAANAAGWTFATGAPEEVDKLTRAFSVRVEKENGTINHGLCTALIGPDGKVLRIWRGNAWTPEEVVEATRAQLSSPES